MTAWITGQGHQDDAGQHREQPGRSPDPSGGPATVADPDPTDAEAVPVGAPRRAPTDRSPRTWSDWPPSASSASCFCAVALFVAVVAAGPVLAGRFAGRGADRAVALVASSARPLILLAVGLVYPGVRTISSRSRNADGSRVRRPGQLQVGSSPTPTRSGRPAQHRALGVLAPLVATALGLHLRRPGRPAAVRGVRQVADLHADGDLVRRRVDHLEVRLRVPRARAQTQIGLLNQIARLARRCTRSSGSSTRRWNTLLLIVVMIWIQAGFAMVDPLGRDQGDPGRHHRGRPPRRRQRVADVLPRHLPSIRPALVVVADDDLHRAR